MNNWKRIQLIPLLAATLLSGQVPAQNWTTVDNLQYVPGQGAEAHSLTADISGNVYATGWGVDAAGIYHGLVLATTDGGATWSTGQDFSNARFYDVGLNPARNLFAAGVATSGPTWLVRRGIKNGSTWSWSTVDNFLPQGYSLTSANGVAVDSAGNTFVAGFGYQPAKQHGPGTSLMMYWIVRKSRDGGQTWSTADGYQYNGSNSSAHAVVITPSGVFVAGTGGGHWLVRQSTDGGLHWTVVDDFLYNGGATVNWLAQDNAGNLYAVGYGGAPAHWLVRKGVNVGSAWSWSTSEDFQYAPNEDSMAEKAGFDTSGNVYVTGYGYDTAGVAHWLTRENTGGGWVRVDDFQYAGGKISHGLGFARDAVGNLYTAGLGRDLANVAHWLVRKSTP